MENTPQKHLYGVISCSESEALSVKRSPLYILINFPPPAPPQPTHQVPFPKSSLSFTATYDKGEKKGYKASPFPLELPPSY